MLRGMFCHKPSLTRAEANAHTHSYQACEECTIGFVLDLQLYLSLERQKMQYGKIYMMLPIR